MISYTSIVLNNDGSWTFSWTPTGAAFYRVVLYGVQIAKVTTPSYTYSDFGSLYGVFPPPLETVAGNTLTPSESYQPYLLIQWYGEPAADSYIVQQYLSGVWQTISQYTESGQWLYSYQTNTESDGQTTLYQVIAIDSVGNQSVPRQFQQNVVCPPAPIDGILSISYNKPNLVIGLA